MICHYEVGRVCKCGDLNCEPRLEKRGYDSSNGVSWVQWACGRTSDHKLAGSCEGISDLPLGRDVEWEQVEEI